MHRTRYSFLFVNVFKLCNPATYDQTPSRYFKRLSFLQIPRNNDRNVFLSVLLMRLVLWKYNRTCLGWLRCGITASLLMFVCRCCVKSPKQSLMTISQNMLTSVVIQVLTLQSYYNIGKFMKPRKRTPNSSALFLLGWSFCYHLWMALSSDGLGVFFNFCLLQRKVFSVLAGELMSFIHIDRFGF